jgi:hypothetical protein
MAQVFHFGPYYWFGPFETGLQPGASTAGRFRGDRQDSRSLVCLPRLIQSAIQ